MKLLNVAATTCLLLTLGVISAAQANISCKTKMLGNTLQVVTKNTGNVDSDEVQVVVNCIVKFRLPRLPWYIRQRVSRRFFYSLAGGEKVTDDVYVCESRSDEEEYGGQWLLEGYYAYSEDYGPSKWCSFEHYHDYNGSR